MLIFVFLLPMQLSVINIDILCFLRKIRDSDFLHYFYNRIRLKFVIIYADTVWCSVKKGPCDDKMHEILVRSSGVNYGMVAFYPVIGRCHTRRVGRQTTNDTGL